MIVGDLKLSDFKQVLMRHHFKAEFHLGDLICNDTIAIKKDPASNRVHLEGALGPDFFRIRELLYQQYAIV